ncbi:CD3324 family protein [Paenibacillus sp. N1-5-1-14]|uniref:CD3324 family protein n=1 Tax=Paenibacillus radicibacter TaxID=2972488 RepID=UPI0021597F17|nr:CD3324 family protein [Paenibacillus radicibacter]MCR8643431.1 CD3324 family protein [Paenibacillus radicibacter]
MKYTNAEIVLPDHLLKEIQKYVHGGLIYVPKKEGARTKWGENSGSRQYLKQRNAEIRKLFSAGTKIDDLQVQYCLSFDSIKKIVYTKT